MTCPQNAGIKRNFRQLVSSCQSQHKFSSRENEMKRGGRQYFNISSKGSHTSDFISLTVMLLHIHRQSWFVFLLLWNYNCFATLQTVCFSFPSFSFSFSFYLTQFMTSALTWAGYYTVSDSWCQSVQRAEVMLFRTTVGKIMIDDLLQSFCSVSVRENRHNKIKSMEVAGHDVWGQWCIVAHLNERQVCI